MGMKYRDPETGQFKDLKVKTSDTLPIGTQVAYGGTVPPTGWLICDGSAVSRTTYAELFKVIGTSYGAGDGSTTFNLPNKKGRVSAGYDSTNSKFNTIGKKLTGIRVCDENFESPSRWRVLFRHILYTVWIICIPIVLGFTMLGYFIPLINIGIVLGTLILPILVFLKMNSKNEEKKRFIYEKLSKTRLVSYASKVK